MIKTPILTDLEKNLKKLVKVDVKYLITRINSNKKSQLVIFKHKRKDT